MVVVQLNLLTVPFHLMAVAVAFVQIGIRKGHALFAVGPVYAKPVQCITCKRAVLALPAGTIVHTIAPAMEMILAARLRVAVTMILYFMGDRIAPLPVQPVENSNAVKAHTNHTHIQARWCSSRNR